MGTDVWNQPARAGHPGAPRVQGDQPWPPAASSGSKGRRPYPPEASLPT